MNISEARDFMREYFEKLYKKYADIDPVLVEMPDLPEEMWADGATPDDEGWCAWKLIPSTVTKGFLYKLKCPKYCFGDFRL